MPTRNINLTTEQDAFVAKVVRSGEYQNASEAIRDALRALQQRRREDELKLAALRAALAEGARALDSGDFDEVDVGGMGEYLAALAPNRRPAGQPTQRKRRSSRTR